MADLLEKVLHHIEGTETEIQNWQTLDGIKTVEFQSFGPDRWIESVHENGRLMAIDCLALILFTVRKSYVLEQERRIVEGWAAELRKAVSAGEIQARDPVTLLALETLPDGWEWLLSMADADKFIAARGMEWRFGEVALHLFNELEQAIENRRFPPWTRTTPATDTAPAQTLAPVADSEWVTKAQTRAREIVKESKELDRYPSQENLGDLIAAEFRKAGVVGADGKPLSGATIKRHALKGISSATGKQLSTTIGRGK